MEGRIINKIRKTISGRTGHRWLAKLEYKWGEVRKVVYNDGHEREDMQKCRNEVFLPRM